MATYGWNIINGVKHYPVMWREVLGFYYNTYPQYWNVPGKWKVAMVFCIEGKKTFYLADGTLGGGNHSKLLLKFFKNMKIAGRFRLRE